MLYGGELVLEYFVSFTGWDDKMSRPYKTIRNNLKYKARIMNTFRVLLWFVMVRQCLILIMLVIPSVLALMQPCDYTPEEHPWKNYGKYIPETSLKFYLQDQKHAKNVCISYWTDDTSDIEYPHVIQQDVLKHHNVISLKDDIVKMSLR